MRKIILVFAAVLLASVGWSQTMTITLEDGSTVKYNMNKVKSIDFTSDDSENNQDATSSLIGTWQVTFVEGWGHSVTLDGEETEYVQFKADGTYIDVIIKNEEPHIRISLGAWSVMGNDLILREKDGRLAGSSFTYTILENETNKLTLSMFGATSYLIRVEDSEIEKYLND